MHENIIYFQSLGNVFSETFSNILEAKFFLEMCPFTVLNATIDGKSLEGTKLEQLAETLRQKSFIDLMQSTIQLELPKNLQAIMGKLDWYVQMEQKEKVYPAGLRSEENRLWVELSTFEI